MQATDCSFLYFNLEILDAALSEACTRPEEARKLPYILAAFSDAHSLLSSSSGSAVSSHEVRLSFSCFSNFSRLHTSPFLAQVCHICCLTSKD